MYSRREVLRLLGHGALAAGSARLLTGCGVAGSADTVTETEFAELARKLQGPVLIPTSARYDDHRRTFSFNPRTDRRPAAIAKCQNEVDVARCIEFARVSGLEIAVRSGGHDVLAASTCDDGLLIDLADMNSIRLDDNLSLAVTGPGASAGALDRATTAQGRLLALGCNAQVGVAGLTLGGGLGWFMGKLGAACDSLQHARLVTADSEILTVSEDQHTELLWGLRGGGGNFGVVTQLTLDTHPLTEMTGGYICFDGERLPEFLCFYRDYLAAAPDELDVEVLVMAPARRVIFVMACYMGDAVEAQRALAPLRSFAKPLADGLRVAPYPDVMTPTESVGRWFQPDPQAPAEPQDAPGVQWLGGSLDELDDAAIETIIRRVDTAQGGWAFNIGHYLHGAVCRPPATGSALQRPLGTFTYHYAAWWGSAAGAAASMAWVDNSVAAMRPHETAAYVNYLSHGDAASVARSYGESYVRLQALKRRYDPDNAFHRNRNIRL